jgi:RNA polymerase sigma factor (TIGR02999 family)
MAAADLNDVTHLLDAWAAGDPAALEQVIPLVIDDLRRLARSYMARQKPGHTLQPTALLHEAYLRLVGRRTMPWRNRTQFFAYVASTMRRILINHARDREAEKRGGEATCVSLDGVLGVAAAGGSASRAVDLLDLDRALSSLAAVDPRQGRIVELRYFGGLTNDETAEVLGVSPRTVKREWHSARLWLLRALDEHGPTRHSQGPP